MSSELPSSQPPVSLQFGNSETTGGSSSFAGYVAGSVQFLSGQDRLDTLPRAEGASFNSAELEHENLCLDGTRTKILQLIEQWTVDPHSKRVFWLSGMAGTGKSAIARTVATNLSKKDQLGASFFFSRGRGDRGNASKFFTSIAYQLALLDTENGALARSIRKAIDQHPDIFTRTKRDQWKFLIQEPLSQLKSQSTHGAVLVLVIDALDECEDEKDVQLILKILCESKDLKRIQFRVFVTGRPRLSVRDAIVETDHQNLILHDIEQHIVQEDLRIFFGHELRSLQRKRGDFLDDGDIEALVQRAGELFIYAATICLFIAERAHPPRERLEIILQNTAFTQSPEKNLDQLYLQILREAIPTTDSARDKTVFCSKFRVFVGSVVSLFSSLSITSLAALLFEKPESIKHTLDDLWSILNVPQKADATISLIHPSFRDFLLDQERCDDPDFQVNSAEAHHVLFTGSLRLMGSSLRRDICDLRLPGSLIMEIDPETIRKHIPSELEYACTSWVRHLESSLQAANDIPGHDVLNTIRHFLEQKALYWLEALSLLGKMQESVLMLSTLLTIVQSCDDRRLANLVHDAYRFTLNHRSIIEQAPLQTYCSALMFSPSESVLRKVFESQLPRWITCLSGVTNDWGSLMQTLEGEDHVEGVRFSPDGEKLMCVSKDLTVRVWDATTGTLLHTLQDNRLSKHEISLNRSLYFLFNGQNIAFVWPNTIEVWDVILKYRIQKMERNDRDLVALSPVEQKLASGSSSGTVRVWDIASGTLLQTYEDCRRIILSLEFSPDGQKLASVLRNRNTILIWDLGSGSSSTLQIHPRHENSRLTLPLIFSRNGQRLACGFDFNVGIWDAESRTLLQTLKCHHFPQRIAFLLNEQHFAFWGANGIVEVWSIPSGSLLRTIKRDKKQSEYFMAFSPNGERLASVSHHDWRQHIIKIWGATFESPLSQEPQGHDNFIRQLVFSPCGQKLASLSYDEDHGWKYFTICLWNVATGSLLETIQYPKYVHSVVFLVGGAAPAFFDGEYIWNAKCGVRLRIVTTAPDWINDRIPDHANQPHGVDLSSRWVTVNQKRVVWLPETRAASTIGSYGTKVAIGSIYGVVTILDLDPKLIETSTVSLPNLGHIRAGSLNEIDTSDSGSTGNDLEYSEISDLENEDTEMGVSGMEDSEVEDSDMGNVDEDDGDDD